MTTPEPWQLTDEDRAALEDALNESLADYPNASFLIPVVESIKAAAYRAALTEAAEAVNLHRQVPTDRDDLDGLCEDDECLWWDMTYALRDELLARAGEVGDHE